MPLPELTPDIESAIRAGHAQGHLQKTIAADLGVSQDIVSRWSKRIGLIWAGNPARQAAIHAANDATRQRLHAARAQLAEAALADAIAIRERLWDEYTVIVSTPDGPQRETLELPDAKAVADFTNAINKLAMTHDNMTRLGSGTAADQAKSMLVQMQKKLLEAVQAEDGEGEGE